MDIEKRVQTEDKFLHAIASPLMIAIVHCDTLKAQKLEPNSKSLEKLEEALQMIKSLLEARRKMIGP